MIHLNFGECQACGEHRKFKTDVEERLQTHVPNRVEQEQWLGSVTTMERSDGEEEE